MNKSMVTWWCAYVRKTDDVCLTIRIRRDLVCYWVRLEYLCIFRDNYFSCDLFLNTASRTHNNQASLLLKKMNEEDKKKKKSENAIDFE